MELPRESRAVLVQRAQAGDRQAFETLIEASRSRVKSYVRSRFGSHLRGATEVDDVLQETFLRAFRSIARFRPEGEDAFVRWLCGIAEHVILKLAGREERRRKLRLGPGSAEEDSTPSQALRRDERFERLQKALQGLSEDHRQVILLARIEGLRMEEIARRMNRSPNAVMLLLSRALKKLRVSFGETESFHLPLRRLKERGDER